MNNNNMNINKMVDKGWDEMSRILDKKLPLTTPANYRYKLVAAFVIFIFLSLSALYFLTSKNYIEVINSSNSQYVKAQEKFHSNIYGLNENKKTELFESDFIAKAQSNQIKNSKYKNFVPHNNYLNNQQVAPQMQNAVKHTDKKTIDKINLVTAQTKGFDENKTGSNFLSFTAVDSKIDELEYLRSPLKLKEFVPVVSMVKHKARKENFFTTGINVVSENFQSFGGGEVAFLYNYNLYWNMYLSSGLEISFLSKSKIKNSFFKTYDIKDPFNDFASSVPNRETYFKTYKNPVLRSLFIDKLLYAGIPVMLSVNTKKINFKMGAKVSYLALGTNYTSQNKYYYGYNLALESRYSYYNSGIYNLWEYGLKLGFDYNISSRFSVGYDINYSFSHIIDSPDYMVTRHRPTIRFAEFDEKTRYDRNFYFGLGLKYKL